MFFGFKLQDSEKHFLNPTPWILMREVWIQKKIRILNPGLGFPKVFLRILNLESWIGIPTVFLRVLNLESQKLCKFAKWFLILNIQIDSSFMRFLYCHCPYHKIKYRKGRYFGCLGVLFVFFVCVLILSINPDYYKPNLNHLASKASCIY